MTWCSDTFISVFAIFELSTRMHKPTKMKLFFWILLRILPK